MADLPPGAGFNQHVWGQLNDYANQASQQSRGRGRGYPRAPRGRVPYQNQNLPSNYSGSHLEPSIQSPPPTMEAFPPLGSGSLASPSPQSQGHTTQPFSQPRSQSNTYLNRPPPRNSHTNTSSSRVSQPYTQSYQPSTQNSQPYTQSSQPYTQSPQPYTQGSQPYTKGSQLSSPARQQFPQDYRRPTVPSGNLYQPAQMPQTPQTPGPFGAYDPAERTFRQQVMAQSDYLNTVQNAARQKYQLKQEEQLQKEAFRRSLESLFQNLLAQQYPAIDPSEVRLRCYGSLNNGFGLADCDMDLLLALPDGLDFINKAVLAAQAKAALNTTKSGQDSGDAQPGQDQSVLDEPDDSQFEVAQLIEGALLDLGIGARLLTKTRVPILRVCEKPNADLLESLRNYRKECAEAAEFARTVVKQDSVHTPPDMSMTEIMSALSELSSEDAAAQVSLPESPPKTKQSSLEFVGECGIQCDINFTNFVAIHNTRLLREYCQYDSRVAEIGTFVKAWAKIRDINTPYLGTLSSYGYTLMVLHYLMNVVQPPVIPNLQQLAYNEDSWASQPPPKFEGKYDIRFWQDSGKLQSFKATQPRNRESTGHLLRGFFWYYSAREGFNFKNDIISIRSRGGVLRKANKGWTEAKWSDQKRNVRQRYLLAIEDPFELDHNVARVVGHNGIVAIRDEFRRAWNIITAVGGPNPPTMDLLEPAAPRGDLLRKDQDHHREKIKKMKQEMEAKQKEALQKALISTGGASDVTAIQSLAESQEQTASHANGMLKQEASCSEAPSPPTRSSGRRRPPKNKQLTRDNGARQDSTRQQRRGRKRKVKDESDDEDDEENSSQSAGKRQRSASRDSDDRDRATEPEPFCSPEELSRSQGYDLDGNPVAWDLSTQDGRWLQWRDTKVRKGEWREPKQGHLAEYSRKYPYDPRRPIPEDADDLRIANELFYVKTAPYPLNKEQDITSSESAIAAHIIKPYLKKISYATARKATGRKPSSRKTSGSNLEAISINNVEGSSYKSENTRDHPRSGLTTIPTECITEKPGLETTPNYSVDEPEGVECAVGPSAGGASPEQVTHHIPTGAPMRSTVSGKVTGPQVQVAVNHIQHGRSDSCAALFESNQTRSSPSPNGTMRAEQIRVDPDTSPELEATLMRVVQPKRRVLSPRNHLSAQLQPSAILRREASVTDSRVGQRDSRPVGLPIEWDVRTKGGRWLRSRDSWTRLGKFSTPHKASPYRDLHERFPYDSSMPRWRLEAYNRELRMFYLNSVERQELLPPATHSKPTAVIDQQPLIQLTESTKPNDGEDWPQYSLSNGNPPDSSVLDLLSSIFHPASDALSETESAIQEDSDTMPDSAFIRSRRLAYYVEKERRESQSETQPDGNYNMTDITVMMRDAGIVSEDRSDNYPRMVPASTQTTTLIRPQNLQASFLDRSDTNLQTSFASSFESGTTNLTRTTAATEQDVGDQRQYKLEVPLSLYPDSSFDKRPRDEDPRIMPIPREFGFKFDVRQLRDLAVIKEGGNGCAIEGYEFEIQEEDDDEWIGSGAIDWTRTIHKGTRTQTQQSVQYEYGKGDEEGLLDELPGPDI